MSEQGDDVTPEPKVAGRRLCEVDGCERVRNALGLCRPHRSQQRHAVDPEFAERQRARWRVKAQRGNSRRREQARVYRELLERGLLP